MNWTDEVIESRRRREERREHQETIFPARAERLWKGLVAAIGRDTESLNRGFADEPNLLLDFEHQSDSPLLSVKQIGHFPSLELTIHFKPYAQAIEIKWDAHAYADAPCKEYEDLFHVSLDNDGNARLMHKGERVPIEGASKHLLMPFVVPESLGKRVGHHL